MQEKNVKIYITECNRKYFTKLSCSIHEKTCRCWKHPKMQTCLTCKFGIRIYGMKNMPTRLNKRNEWDCSNSAFNHELHFTPAHEKAKDLNINCPIWEKK